MFRKTVGLELVPQLVAINEHGKFAARAALEHGFHTVVSLDRSRETRSVWLVISHHAVENFDGHGAGFSR